VPLLFKGKSVGVFCCVGRSGDWKGDRSVRSPFCAVATATQAFKKTLKVIVTTKEVKIVFYLLIFKFVICILHSCLGVDDTQKVKRRTLSGLSATAPALLYLLHPCSRHGAAALNVFLHDCQYSRRTSAERAALFAIHGTALYRSS